MNDIDCSFDSEICGLTEGGGTCSETFNDEGTYYRGCSVGLHCADGGMKIAITVQDECTPTEAPPSPKYRSYSGIGNNLANPTWGTPGSRYRRSTSEYHDRLYYAHWGTDSSFSELLTYCSGKTQALNMGFLDGGGGTPYLGVPLSPFAPPLPHFWIYGDPVLFCKYFLVDYIGAADAPSGLTQEALDNAPVLPGPREVSNVLFTQRQMRTTTFTNDLGTYWGMFVTTDTTSQTVDRALRSAIVFPQSDRWYDTTTACCSNPAANFSSCIMGRDFCYDGSSGRLSTLNSDPISEDRPRVAYNEISHFFDLSQIYGFDNTHEELVADEDPSMLNTTATETPYFFFFGNALFRGQNLGVWDKRGDIRLNKTPQMKILGDLFVRNHNRLASILFHKNRTNPEVIFEEARRINIAQYQDIVFREYLPSILGRPLNPYDTNKDGLADTRTTREFYDPNVDASLDVAFSVAAYRFGHTKLATNIPRRDRFFDDAEHSDGSLRNCYWNISLAVEYENAAEDIIRGLVSTRQVKTGAWGSDDVRNLMFGEINHGEDLISQNIYRGREVGLPPVNAIRESLGLEPYISCRNISTEPRVIDALHRLYGEDNCIDRIDLFVAGVAEEPLEQASVGETFWWIIFDAFSRLRNGDRYWYENQLDQQTAEAVGRPYSYNPYPLSDSELADVYETSLEQLFAANYDDIEVGDLGNGLFFLRNRQLETLQLEGQFVVTNASDPEEFELSLQLSPSYLLEWRLDDDDNIFTVRMTVATLGWVGFGLEPDDNTMKNADIYFCQVIDGEGIITDRFALDVGPPTLDTDIGGDDDILSFSASEVDGNTVCQFSRKVDTGDNNFDKVIRNEKMKTMFAFNPETDDLVYHGPTRQSDIFINFYDTLPVDEVPDGLLIILGVLAGLGILFALVIIVVIFLKEDFFRLMSPMFCQLICVGAMFCFGSVLTLVKNNPPSEASCTAYPWFLGIGFMVVYGCLFAKTWRLYRVIKTSMKMKTKVITNTDVLTMIVVFTVPMIVLLVIWTAVDGFDVLHEFTDDEMDETRDICDTPTVWWALFVAFLGLVLIVGSVLTFLIRNLPEEFNDSEAIGFSIYNALLMLVVGAGIGWGLNDTLSAVVAMQGFTVLVFTWFALVVLFVPTLYRLATGAEPRQFKSQMGTLNTGAGASTNIGGGGSTIGGSTVG